MLSGGNYDHMRELKNHQHYAGLKTNVWLLQRWSNFMFETILI